jgi:hypothetical protein
MLDYNFVIDIPGVSSPKDIYVALSSPAPLLGMPRPRNGFPWGALASKGISWVVALEDGGYDPSPLRVLCNERLEDLSHGGLPRNPRHEKAVIVKAVEQIAKNLRSGHGVVVHCAGGRGRTGTVIGCVLREFGNPAEIVLDYLDKLHKARGRPGWPESPWQGSVVKTWGT